MNNEKEHETQQEKASGQFWQDKALPFFKSLLTDKIKCLYIIALFLQMLFLLLQFVPVMELATEVSGGWFTKYQFKIEKLSLLQFSKEVPGIIVFFVFDIILFAFSLKSTVTYFIRKYDKMKGGFLLAKVSTIFILILFGITTAIASSLADKVADSVSTYGNNVEKIFSLTFGGHLYWMVGVALLVVFFVLGIKVKEKREEERVNARVVEELQKQKGQENVQ